MTVRELAPPAYVTREIPADGLVGETLTSPAVAAALLAEYPVQGVPVSASALDVARAWRDRQPEARIPAPSLTREKLDKLQCGNPECAHADCELVLYPACHPGSPTWTKYNKLTGAAIVFCAECGKTCARLSVRD